MPGLSRKAKSLVTQPYDFLVESPTESDLVVMVMGAKGAGKTTFIDTVLGRDRGSATRPTTAENHVKHEFFYHPEHNRRILLVDTPSFDDRTISDTEVLRRIAVWLGESYRLGMKLAGLIYLHDISRELEAPENMDYEILKKLCGKEGASKALLATTMWDKIGENERDERMKRLKETWWNDMGSSVYRVERERDIVDSVLSQGFRECIQIQRELVEQRRELPDTKAYKHLMALKGQEEIPQKSCC